LNLGDADGGDVAAGDVAAIAETIGGTLPMEMAVGETAEDAVEDGDVAEAGDVGAGRLMVPKSTSPTATILMMNSRP
jgi:hypothetical protein